MNVKLRKKNKSSLNAREPILNGESAPASPTKSSFAVSATTPAAPALPQTSSFAKTASDILTPDMTDIEKLQKLKEWILADQHPYFTSAPKVAHLLSLRVSASASNANSNTSGSSGEQERPLSSIPLAERLSSPKMVYPAGGPHQNSIYKGEDDPSSRQREEVQDDVSMNDADHMGKNEDVEMPESRYRETTGPPLTPTHTEPLHPLAYTRPEDPERKNELLNGRQSPRNEGRGYGGYADGQSRGNGRYEPRGRYRGSGGYINQGNRRFSNEQTDQRYHDHNRDRDYDRKPDYAAGHTDDRRNSARSFGDSPAKYGRQSYDGRSGEQARARVPSDHIPQPLATDTSADTKPDEDTKDRPENVGAAAELDTTLPLTEAQTELPSASPTSAGNGPPQSVPESVTTVPAAASPPRSEIALDASPGRAEQEERPIANRSPLRSASIGHRDFKNGRDGSRDRDPRSNFNADRYHHQDNRPRADSYQKYPATSKPYDRPLPPRDDNRTFASREPYYRPAYAPTPPVDDRRFVPREAGYPDDPGYAPRRDYRPGEWDNKRRDVDRPLDRPYERDRDRDVRGPLISPNDVRGPRIPHAAAVPPRGYPPERDGPRGPSARNAHDTYPPHAPAHDPRGYDREPYGGPPPPLASSYLREPSRVRPRSLSPPPRRDYRLDQRPPAKRPRGPDDPYIMPPPAPANGHYAQSNYGPPSGRAQDYPGDRRPIPSGPAYYRPEDRRF